MNSQSNLAIEHKKTDFRLFCGSANKALGDEIAGHLQIPLSQCRTERYPDGEIKIHVEQNVRGKDVFIVQPTCPPNVNDNLMEIILLISTMRRSSAGRITAVIPYYGYCRQDRKFRGRVPIAAADVARLLEAMGIDRVVVVDLHCGQIQGFFGPTTPCDNLESAKVAAHYFVKNNLVISNKTVIVSPDAGGVQRAKKFRDFLKFLGIEAELSFIIKQRSADDSIEKIDLIGNVHGLNAIIVDDMIDTAGTLVRAGEELKRCGAEKIYAYATHGLFSQNALERIEGSAFEKVVVTNTIPLPKGKSCSKVVQISISKLLAKAINRIYLKLSLSDMFKDDKSSP